MVGKIWGKGGSWAGSERERDLWTVRVVSWESKKMWQEHEQASQRGTGMRLTERTIGSWFQRHGEAYLKERSVMRNEDAVGGRARVTWYEERVLRGGWTDEVMQIRRLRGCEDFVSEAYSCQCGFVSHNSCRPKCSVILTKTIRESLTATEL